MEEMCDLCEGDACFSVDSVNNGFFLRSFKLCKKQVTKNSPDAIICPYRRKGVHGMRKEWSRLLLVAGCLLIGCLLGYFVSVTQAREQDDPAYLAYFEEHDLPVPEPAEPLNNIAGAGLLLAGVPTGLMLYRHIAGKWGLCAGKKLLIGIVTFPIYTLLGVVGSIPFLLYQVIRLVLRK